MKVLISGATGLIGRNITQKLISRGDEVIILTRSVKHAKKIIPDATTYIDWETDLFDQQIFEINAVINLAGENVMARRWSDSHKKKILESRVISTRNLIEFISKLETKPEVFVSASAIGIYGTDNREVDENSNEGDDFLASVVKEWENESKKVDQLSIRRVNIRIGIVLEKKEGALAKMIFPFKYFIGGPIGSGKQWISWIHIEDIVEIFLFSLDNRTINGAVNGVAPAPVTMKKFAQALGKEMNRPSFIAVPEFILKVILGEGAQAVLGGSKVKADKIMSAGYNFRFNTINDALQNILLK